MPFIEYENHNLPLSSLPYEYKSRLIQLASLSSDATKISTALSDLGTLNRRRECFNRVFITDNNNACKLAKDEYLYNWIQNHIFDLYWIRYFTDGPRTFDSAWQEVLLVDELDNKSRPFRVNELVLYLTSVESYDRLKPFMVTSYNVLVIYGQFTWAHIKHLIHDKVKQVRIMGKVEVNPENYDDVVKFVLRFPRGSEYKFIFHQLSFPSELKVSLTEACTSHDTFTLISSGSINRLECFVKTGSVSAFLNYALLTCLSSVFFLFAIEFFNNIECADLTKNILCYISLTFCVLSLIFSFLILSGFSEHLTDVELHKSILNSL